MSDKLITLSDRIKELSRSTGTGNLRLDGAVNGFDSFGSTYSYNDLVFYAVTNGSDYEVGSGQYILDGGNNALRRFPVVSSNSNAAVNFSAGIKEVYVTYPGKFAVFTASGLNGFIQPDVSGVAFWGGSQALNYSQDIVWDNVNSRLGIRQPSPQFTIDVGGLESYSAINISGVIVGDSGVMFSGVDPSYSGGRQLEPFLRNQLDVTTGTSDVFSLSGLVDQRLLFKQQNAGLVFAGPPSGCTPPATCSPDYPSFRALTLEDLPYLGDEYVTTTGTGGAAGRVAFYHSSGIIDSDAYFYWDNVSNFLGVNQNNPAANLDVSGNARITSNLVVGGDVTVTGNINATQIVFGDSSVISGAYQAGSGLELHNGIEFNIGNLFNVADNTATSGWIHQGDVLAISGVSGVFTDYNTNSNILYIGSSGGYGVMKSWNVSDGIGGSGDIKHNNQLTISGVSGVTTQYDLTNKLLRIGVSDSGHTIKLDNVITVPLSGITLIGEQTQNGVALSSGDRVLLVNQTDARENGIWEVGADPYGSWTRPTDFPSSGEASARWTHVQFGTHYDESVWFCVNNYPTRIDYDNQEWRYFDGGAGASGWANARDLAISGWASNSFASINNEITGGSGIEVYNYEARTAGTGNFDQLLFTNHINRIGEYAGSYVQGDNEHNVFLGTRAGLSGTAIRNNVVIGSGAGKRTIDSDDNIMIGTDAGVDSSGNNDSLNIGFKAGANSQDMSASIAVGPYAGDTSSLFGNSVAVGNQSASGSTSFVNSISMGYVSALKAFETYQSVYIGDGAGANAYRSSGVIGIGRNAGNLGSGIQYSIYLGDAAGLSARGSKQIIFNTDPSTVSTWWYLNKNAHHVLSIGDTITGQTSDKLIRVGATGTIADYGDATLTVKSADTTRTALKLVADNTNAADQFVSSSGNGANNPIINTSGLLRIPVFPTVATATGALGLASVNNSGVLVLAGDRFLVSDGYNWVAPAASWNPI